MRGSWFVSRVPWPAKDKGGLRTMQRKEEEINKKVKSIDEGFLRFIELFENAFRPIEGFTS